ncbi:RNA-binding protein fusilli-like [Schistocerca cancellata]|uniref:RNA-binding protein fusilli-like n=1 Tax=Schistocerca cancellata TaxID=274614 RepID=UPI00211884A2|nr:RNA-binding protein fusilli-like [Schistocerca cancellata]
MSESPLVAIGLCLQVRFAAAAAAHGGFIPQRTFEIGGQAELNVVMSSSSWFVLQQQQQQQQHMGASFHNEFSKSEVRFAAAAAAAHGGFIPQRIFEIGGQAELNVVMSSSSWFVLQQQQQQQQHMGASFHNEFSKSEQQQQQQQHMGASFHNEFSKSEVRFAAAAAAAHGGFIPQRIFEIGGQAELNVVMSSSSWLVLQQQQQQQHMGASFHNEFSKSEVRFAAAAAAAHGGFIPQRIFEIGGQAELNVVMSSSSWFVLQQQQQQQHMGASFHNEFSKSEVKQN